MDNNIERPVFKRGSVVYIERKTAPGTQLRTDIFKVRDDGNIEVYPPVGDTNIRISFKNGEDITLYYWYEGVRYFCKTMIIEYINAEQVYSIIVPKRMSKDATRRWNRHHINLPVAFLKFGGKEDDIVSEDKLFSGVTVNVSGGGALIVTKKKLLPGEYLGIAFMVANEICIMESKVIKIDVTENANTGFDLILEFFKFSDSDKGYLDNLLLKHKQGNYSD